MRRLLISCLVVSLAACSSNASPPAGTPIDGAYTDETLAPPGNCVPGDALPTVQLVVDGKTVIPTFGIGSNECATATGNGYIAFDYDPVLVDTKAAIEVIVDGEATVALSWPLGEPFTQTSPGRWRSGAPTTGCERLTIEIVSLTGTSSETVGADIRVGGTGVNCKQRGLEPTQPIDTASPDDTGNPDDTGVGATLATNP